MPPPCDALVLGAGPAGMAAAMELCRAGRRVAVVEKEAQVGGLAKTLVFQEPEGTYRTDIGPHRFYSKNRYLYDFIEDLLGDEWIEVPRRTRFYVGGHFYHYPIQLGNILRTMPLSHSLRMGRDFLHARLSARCAPRMATTFEGYATATFGKALAAFSILNYTEKIWGIPAHAISVDWAEQRIGGLTLWSTLKKALLRSGGSGPKTLVDSFFYPSLGAGRVYERIRERLEEEENAVLLETVPTRIRWHGRRVDAVETRRGEDVRVWDAPAFLMSVPLTAAIRLFDPPPPPEIRAAAERLRFRAQVYLFLTIEREQVTPDNWVYFPEPHVPFGRITEMKNFSAAMAPPGHTSLLIEYFCFEGDRTWTMEKEELAAQTVKTLEMLGMLQRSDVRSIHHFRIAKVYPLYDLAYREHRATVLAWLDSFDNLYAIGRPGRFRYTNQDHSLEMGILAAQSVLTGKRHNVDDVGAEREYFERGYVPGGRLTPAEAAGKLPIHA